MNKYEEERFDPKTPQCAKANMSLFFNGQILTLKIYGHKVIEKSYKAASGKPDAKMNFDYSEKRQKTSYIGPIPQGQYWITVSELWENAWYRPGSTEAWGDYRIAIHPYPTTNTYNRGGFFIHGGKVLGSAGCVDLTSYMNKFVEDLRKALPGSKDCYIPFTVRYK